MGPFSYIHGVEGIFNVYMERRTFLKYMWSESIINVHVEWNTFLMFLSSGGHFLCMTVYISEHI